MKSRRVCSRPTSPSAQPSEKHTCTTLATHAHRHAVPHRPRRDLRAPLLLVLLDHKLDLDCSTRRPRCYSDRPGVRHHLCCRSSAAQRPRRRGARRGAPPRRPLPGALLLSLLLLQPCLDPNADSLSPYISSQPATLLTSFASPPIPPTRALDPAHPFVVSFKYLADDDALVLVLANGEIEQVFLDGGAGQVRVSSAFSWLAT